MKGTITTLDLFAGAGGLSRGLHAASERFIVDTAVEMDGDAAATFELAFPEAEVHAQSIEDWLAEGEIREVDVVVGGPPCQGFSALGKQDVRDERNTLWRRYVEAVKASNARYFIIENVPQFLKSPQFDLFREEIEAGDLQDYAFDVEVLDASDYGAAQKRKRAIVLGWRRDVPRIEFPDITHREKPVTVREVLEDVRSDVDRIDLPPQRCKVDGRNTPGPFRLDELHLTRRYTDLSLDRFSYIKEGGNRFQIPEELLSACWRKHKSGSGDVMGRLNWDQPSVTIRTEFFKPEKGRYLHPTENRAITHLEAGLLQGFGPESLWVGSKTSIARQIGNAVPVALGAAIGEKIIKAMDSGIDSDNDTVDEVRGIDGSNVLPDPEDRPAA